MLTTTLQNDLILRAARGERTERTPVWLMRQAGRFDPEYRALRERYPLPLEETFRNPDLAARITLLPKRFGVDALILFQDILTLTSPMGAPFRFRPGPELAAPIRDERAVRALREYEPREELADVVDAIRLVTNELDGELPLLGFAGAPLTVAAFMIEGGSPGGRIDQTRALMQEAPAVMHELLERLTSVTTSYLHMQIEAGVDGVQLFESIGDMLSEDEYRTFAHPYHARIFAALNDVAVPRILFVKERGWIELMAASGADVLSVGSCVNLAEARRRLGDCAAFQGNVSNRLLAEGGAEEIRAAVEACIRAGGHEGHILNLDHGLLRDTPVDNVRLLIDTCHEFRA